MTDWANLLSGVVGGLVGAGGAVGTTLITTRSDRAARKADRDEDRADRAAERAQERAARRLDQGRTAARDALAITSKFFTTTGDRAGPNNGDSFIGYAGWGDMRIIDDLAELIDSEKIRGAVRSTVNAIGTAGYVTMLIREYDDPEQWDLTRRRERDLLLLMRRTLGSYLRDEEDQYATLLAEATKEEEAGQRAADQIQGG
ncbi:hypothetical protein ACIQUC_15770 [Curtobacterium sp. NPDC098951]|uniref:hypothetical protein n=1 Tax=Curtobacterium sp. NPDC098951 TaxID=3363974 RepID=UPI00381F704C